ncbi:MAG: hypothetical protein ABFC96_05595 [Thermoguttaceae bacterium]
MLEQARRITCAALSCLLLCGSVAARPLTIGDEAGPTVYYLPDKEGRLQPVLGFQFQDFSRLYDLKNQLSRPEQPPRFRIERLVAAGSATLTHADLTIQFQLVTRDDGWVRVPLRLDQGLLRGSADHQGPGEQLLEYAGDGTGYVVWLHAKSGTRHQLTLRILVPLDVAGDETRLKLRFPPHGAGEMKLTAPQAAGGAVSPGAILMPPPPTKGPSAPDAKGPNGDAGTEFRVVGLPSDFQLAWRKRSSAATDAAPVLEASGTVLARLDGRGISTEATLTVRSLTTAFDRFLVRLPADTALEADGRPEPIGSLAAAAPVAQSRYSLRALPDKTAGKSDVHRLVEVRLPKQTLGPAEVRLRCRRVCNPWHSDFSCDLAGFDVRDAARQGGVVAVAADEGWQVFFGPSREMRPLAPLPDALRKENVVAGFEYHGQPYSLPVRLAPRAAQSRVDPQYLLLVDHDQVRLDARLRYTIQGAKISTLELTAAGWTVDDVGPECAVRIGGVGRPSPQALLIPLARPSSGTIELRVRAHRTIPSGASSLVLTLPQPRADSVSPAAVAVLPADDVELNADPQKIEGLEATESATEMKLPPRQQAPLCYQGAGAPAVFAARFRVLPPIKTENAAGTTIVDRAWIQTCLNPTAREDRVVLQVLTDRSHLEVELPRDAAAAAADAIVDGRHVEPRTAADGQLLIPLDRPGRRHVVELRYHFLAARQTASLMLEFPRIRGDVWMRRIYWQLILPPNEHLIVNPAGLTGEFVWGWDGYFWGRHPLLDETELESWIGATQRGPLADRANRYLFSTFGRLEQTTVRTASRPVIVLMASGLVLALGLTLIRVPGSRHPAALLVLAVALIAASLIAPEPAFLLAQASSLGLGLTLLAALLETVLARRRGAATRELSSLQVELAPSRAGPTPSVAPRPSSTKTQLLPSAEDIDR